MATKKWIGAAEAVAQVGTFVITAVSGTPSDTEYFIDINGDTVSVLGDTDVDTTAAALQVALEASTNPYFSNIDWTVATDTITATAGTAGVPFTAVSSDVGGTGTIAAYSATTASDGPNNWASTRNWSDGVVPVSTDTVYIEDSAISITDGLAQSAVTLTELVIKASFTGRIGLIGAFATSANGATTTAVKDEYKAQYLAISATTLSIGEKETGRPQDGSKMIKLNLGSNQATVTVHDTASTSFVAGNPAIQLLGTHASNTMSVKAARSSVGIAVGSLEVSTFATIDVGTDVSSGGVVVGLGTTLTTFRQKSGESFIAAAGNITTLDVLGGDVTTSGEGYLITTVTVGENGVYFANHTNAGGIVVTTLTYLNTGTVDTKKLSEARTFTTVNLVSGAVLKADKDFLTITNLILPSQDYELSIA